MPAGHPAPSDRCFPNNMPRIGYSRMLDNKRVIAVVPARGGSKSIPGKNIRLLSGKPLIAWAIGAGKEDQGHRPRHRLHRRRTGSPPSSWEYGAEVYRRPPHLATDEALVIDALRDLIGTLRQEGESAEIMVLLEATSPLADAGRRSSLP